MKYASFVLLCSLAIVGCSDAAKTSPETQISENGDPVMEPNYVLDHDVNRITGEAESLGQYEGKVVLIVNVASKCGYTGQYEQLEALYKQHKDDGFVVLGFPANNFLKQEPGSDEEILEFCTSTYDVTFPMFSKIDVLGEEAHSLYKDLAGQPEPIGGEPQWNFTKFLVNRQGQVISRFDTKTSPDDEQVVAAINALL